MMPVHYKKFSFWALSALSCVSLLLGGSAEPVHIFAVPEPRPLEENVSVLLSRTYNLQRIRKGAQGVPPVCVHNLALSKTPHLPISRKKSLFLKTMLPMILKVNEKILRDRNRLLHIAQSRKHNLAISPQDTAWVRNLAAQYRASPHNLRELQRRVDIIPASMALAQSIEESGWGGATVAFQKNSPFGQRHLVTKKLRGKAFKTYGLKPFDTLSDAIHSYVHNINTNPAYHRLRVLRASMRHAGEPIDGVRLASGLLKYSELGPTYIKKIQKIIAQNALGEFDKTYLDYSYDYAKSLKQEVDA